MEIHPYRVSRRGRTARGSFLCSLFFVACSQQGEGTLPATAPSAPAGPSTQQEGTPPENGGAQLPASATHSARRRGGELPRRTTATSAGALRAVHEWGTYTSVQSTQGESLPGMHREDEPLPGFVHRRSFECLPGFKCVGTEVVLDSVTQKLETPVLYFYGDPGTRVEVRVDFPKGIISEWFPQARRFSPPPALPWQHLEPVVPAGGSMTWNIELLGIKPDYPRVEPDDIWAPSRYVAATPLRSAPALGANGEEIDDPNHIFLKGDPVPQVERFIFYRGVAAFDVPVRVSWTRDQRMVVHNDSSDEIPAVFVIRSGGPGKGGEILELGALSAGSSRSVEIPSIQSEEAQFLDEAPALVQAKLADTGLYPDEAWAMVDTWTRSYFLHDGLRILYIAPRAWADDLLPISIVPEPAELVRTFVGRIEVLSPAEEQEVVQWIGRHAESGFADLTTFVQRFGRFSEPKAYRACQILGPSGAHVSVCSKLATAFFKSNEE